jgi:hypothetical protein
MQTFVLVICSHASQRKLKKIKDTDIAVAG